MTADHPLRNPAFLALLSFRLLVTLSYQIVAVVVGWHIYELTHDALALGLIGLAEVIPYFCFALFAGYAVDHYSRRRIGLFACALLLVNATMLTVLSSRGVSANEAWSIYGAVALSGVARAFISPAYNSIFGLILPREQFGRAAGIGSSIFQGALVIGPALGGALVGWASKTAAYGTALALAVAAVLALALLRFNEPPSRGERAPIFASIGEGLRFVFGNQVILGAQALDMFAVLFGGAVALLPAFIHDILHYGPEGLGILRAAPAVGAVATGLMLAHRPLDRHAGRLLLATVAGFGVCIILFALSRNFWLSAALLLLSGAFDGVSVVLRSTILQLATPDEMRGRVSSINGLFIGSSNELGAFESGVAARLLGLVPSVIFGGSMTLLVVAITSRLAPRLRQLHVSQLQ